ncbi:reverse transcriptase domain-containing protein [Romboutsia sedimentorum]|uniref:reverse transcriptase domain-containing protein n=1 Tax=Romboutsia sedimentorum TaxID=1368474 RepID=UPI002F3F7780
MDLEKFFDKVNHDILIDRISWKVYDQRVLNLIRKYLKSGIMINGIITSNSEDTPQGGPLSPLLSNIMLDEVDKELENRGHKFCRFADDCNRGDTEIRVKTGSIFSESIDTTGFHILFFKFILIDSAIKCIRL